jgi:hypothetical protein
MSGNSKLIERYPHVLSESNSLVQCFLESGRQEKTVRRPDGTAYHLSSGQEFVSDRPVEGGRRSQVAYSVESMLSSVVLARCIDGGYEWYAGVRGGEPVTGIYELEAGDYLVFLAGRVVDMMEATEASD